MRGRVHKKRKKERKKEGRLWRRTCVFVCAPSPALPEMGGKGAI